MDPASAKSSSVPSRRLLALVSALLLALLAFVIERSYFDPSGREAELQRLSTGELELRAAAGSPEAAVYYLLAVRRRDAGNLQGAEAAANRALEIQPGHSRAHALRGLIQLVTDRDQEALESLTRAAAADPTNAEAHLGLALVYQRLEAWNRQAKAAEAATRLAPGNPDGWVLRAQAATELREHRLAADCYHRAIGLRPAVVRIRILAARAYLALGDPGPAEREAREAVRLAPEDAPAQTALGDVLLRKNADGGRLAEAAYRRAVRLDPSSAEAAAGLGRALQAQGRAAAGAGELRRALSLDPAQSEARYALVRALRAAGRDREAASEEAELARWTRFQEQRTQLHNRIVLDPRKADPWFALARLYASRGFWPAARRMAEAGLRREPESLAGRALMSEIEAHAH